MSRNKTAFPVRRIAIDAVLIAMYFGLSLLSVEVGGIKLTFASLPTLICAMLFGPTDAFLVGLLGAFLEQLIRYPLSATTALWILPPAIRGLFVGVCALLLKKHMSVETILSTKRPYTYFAVTLVSGVLVSTLNTLVYYIDAKLYHYYEYHLIFGMFWIRIASGLLSTMLMAIVALPVVAALQKANFIPSKKAIL